MNTNTVIGADSGDYETHLYWLDEARSEAISHDPKVLHSWFESQDSKSLVFAIKTFQNPFVRAALVHGFRVFITHPLFNLKICVKSPRYRGKKMTDLMQSSMLNFFVIVLNCLKKLVNKTTILRP